MYHIILNTEQGKKRHSQSQTCLSKGRIHKPCVQMQNNSYVRIPEASLPAITHFKVRSQKFVWLDGKTWQCLHATYVDAEVCSSQFGVSGVAVA